jgi:hypothetical protein
MLIHRRRLVLRMLALAGGLIMALGAVQSGAWSQTTPPATQYEFTRVADSAADGFDPFSFGCAAINSPGDIAFKAGRPAPDENTIPGVYRANADGTLTTIAENPRRFVTIGFNPSINDSGQVSFAARLDGGNKPDTEAIFRGDGSKKLTTIASTADEFNFFGFDTSISNSGEVAFKAELDEEFDFVEGLFSGSGGKKSGVTTHYLNSTDVTLDGQPVRFGGNDSRPSINNVGDIAFQESIQPNFDSGIFVGREGTFHTIAAPDPNVFVGVPVLNDAGTAAFYRSFFDEANQVFVEQIVRVDADGTLTVLADTRGEFGSFGFRPPSLNNQGEVAFLATLDDGTTGIFVGPDPVADRVIATGDTLDGETVTSLTFCEEGLNDSGQLAFTAFFEDPETFETRVAVYRATPVP